MRQEPPAICKVWDRIGVWGFGNVSTDVVQSLVEQGLGKEIVFYGRQEEIYELPVDDLQAQLNESAAIIKEDIRIAASVLKEKYSIG